MSELPGTETIISPNPGDLLMSVNMYRCRKLSYVHLQLGVPK